MRILPTMRGMVILASFFVYGVSNTQISEAEHSSAMGSEEVAWAYAPKVPPAITRTEARVVEVNLQVIEGDCELTEGVVYHDCWSFAIKGSSPILNGTIGELLLRVRQGDILNITLTNPSDNHNDHNMAFPFASGPESNATRMSVKPGESQSIAIVVDNIGLYTFLCSTDMPTPTHAANGMHGAIIVDPANGMAPVDHEWFLAQSEFYTESLDGSDHVLSMNALNLELPRFMVYNRKLSGHMGPRALQARPGETVRLFIANQGLSKEATISVLTAKMQVNQYGGMTYDDTPRTMTIVPIPAGAGAVMSFTIPDQRGPYLIVNRILQNVQRGAVGMILAQ